MAVFCFCYCHKVLLIVVFDSVYLTISNSCVYQLLQRKPPCCSSYNTSSSSKQLTEVSKYYVWIKTIHLVKILNINGMIMNDSAKGANSGWKIFFATFVVRTDR